MDSLHEAIKLYVTEIGRESLDEQSGRRAMDIIAFSINLEHIRDIVDKNRKELASKKIENSRQYLPCRKGNRPFWSPVLSPFAARAKESCSSC